MSKQKTSKRPLDEVWAILHIEGHLVPPLDDDSTAVFLAWPTKHDAEIGLAHQIGSGYIEGGTVIRLFP